MFSVYRGLARGAKMRLHSKLELRPVSCSQSHCEMCTVRTVCNERAAGSSMPCAVRAQRRAQRELGGQERYAQ